MPAYSVLQHVFDKPLMTQIASILAHLRKHRRITPLDALRRYNCFRLGARIWDLRRKGHVINMQLAKGDKHYAVYTLVKEAHG